MRAHYEDYSLHQAGCQSAFAVIGRGTPSSSSKKEGTKVPAVRVRLIEVVKLPPRSDQCVVAEVGWEPNLPY